MEEPWLRLFPGAGGPIHEAFTYLCTWNRKRCGRPSRPDTFSAFEAVGEEADQAASGPVGFFGEQAQIELATQP